MRQTATPKLRGWTLLPVAWPVASAPALALAVALGFHALPGHAADDCGARTPDSARQSAILVNHQQQLRTAQNPLQLGFNLEWVQFQRDFWNAKTSALDAALVARMSAFPGAVYRYPGGTVSNYLDLVRSLGPVDQRTPQQPVSWTGPDPMTFGLAEYYDFLAAVKGTPWLVLNVYGRRGAEMPLSVLEPTWQKVAEFVRDKPAPLRFELGNELYLPFYKLDAQSYADRARRAAETLRTFMPDVRTVAVLADFDPPGLRKRDFNRPVSRIGPGLVADFAQHSYYDGPPGGPPVPNRLREICRTVDELAQAGHADPTIWVTEHARWPGGRTSDTDWKTLWPKSNDLEAALGVSDYVIGLSQMRAVRGAFLHSLSGTQGPWTLLMRGNQGALIPSAVYRALEVLQPMFGRFDIHVADVQSTDSAGYPGGYDMRATVARDPTSDTWHLFVVQRAPRPMPLRVRLPGLAGADVRAAHRHIRGAAGSDNNSAAEPARIAVQDHPLSLRFDADGQTTFNLPPLSVNHLILPRPEAGIRKP